MNRIKSLVFLLTAAMLQMAPSLKAQQEVFLAKVPFQFSAGDRTLPAGDYRITRRNAFLNIESRRDSSSMLIVSSSVDSASGAPIHLVFDRVNESYFLREVVARTGSIELPVSRTEKKATKEQQRLSKASLPVVTSTAVQSTGQ